MTVVSEPRSTTPESVEVTRKVRKLDVALLKLMVVSAGKFSSEPAFAASNTVGLAT